MICIICFCIRLRSASLVCFEIIIGNITEARRGISLSEDSFHTQQTSLDTNVGKTKYFTKCTKKRTQNKFSRRKSGTTFNSAL